MFAGLIEKSGTGIEKSGTGIEKSGTGIEKSGTGWRAGGLIAVMVMLIAVAPVIAGGSSLLVSKQGDQLMVSVHSLDGIVAGTFSEAVGHEAYLTVPLFNVSNAQPGEIVIRPLVQGSGSGKEVQGSGSGKEVQGSGSGKEVQGSGSGKEVQGSGSGKEVQGSGSGKEVQGSGSGKEVQGSGSGAAGEACVIGGQVLVQGSGSGKEVQGSGSGKEVQGSGSGKEVQGSGSGKEVQGSGSGKEVQGSGSGKEVQGSGSGAAGENVSGCEAMGVWGYAEIVLDTDGMHVIVHRHDEGVFVEHLVGFVEIAGDQIDPRTGQAFIAAP